MPFDGDEFTGFMDKQVSVDEFSGAVLWMICRCTVGIFNGASENTKYPLS